MVYPGVAGWGVGLQM